MGTDVCHSRNRHRRHTAHCTLLGSHSAHHGSRIPGACPVCHRHQLRQDSGNALAHHPECLRSQARSRRTLRHRNHAGSQARTVQQRGRRRQRTQCSCDRNNIASRQARPGAVSRSLRGYPADMHLHSIHRHTQRTVHRQ